MPDNAPALLATTLAALRQHAPLVERSPRFHAFCSNHLAVLVERPCLLAGAARQGIATLEDLMAAAGGSRWLAPG